MRALVAYDWPGNVRELESAIERAVLLGDEAQIVHADLPLAVRAGISATPAVTDLEIPDGGIDLEQLEATLIRKALDKAGGNVTRAARLLGLSRRTLQYRLGRLEGAPSGADAAPDRAGSRTRA
jgi:transcriptional regulator with PAS, ATPase and Fis domain